MDRHDVLKAAVKEALDKLFDDTSVDQETTRESLESAIENIKSMLDSLE